MLETLQIVRPIPEDANAFVTVLARVGRLALVYVGIALFGVIGVFAVTAWGGRGALSVLVGFTLTMVVAIAVMDWLLPALPYGHDLLSGFMLDHAFGAAASMRTTMLSAKGWDELYDDRKYKKKKKKKGQKEKQRPTPRGHGHGGIPRLSLWQWWALYPRRRRIFKVIGAVALVVTSFILALTCGFPFLIGVSTALVVSGVLWLVRYVMRRRARRTWEDEITMIFEEVRERRAPEKEE